MLRRPSREREMAVMNDVGVAKRESPRVMCAIVGFGGPSAWHVRSSAYGKRFGVISADCSVWGVWGHTVFAKAAKLARKSVACGHWSEHPPHTTQRLSLLVFFGLFSLETSVFHPRRKADDHTVAHTPCAAAASLWRKRTHYACRPSSRLRNTPKCGKLCALSHRLPELFARDLFAHGPQKGRFECQGLPARHPFSAHSSIK